MERVEAGASAARHATAWKAVAVLVDESGTTLALRAAEGATEEAALHAACAALPGVARSLAAWLLVETREAAVAERLGEALRIPTAAVARGADLPGLAPGEEVELARGGTLAGYAWRPREAWEPLTILPGHRMDAKEALLACRTTTRGEAPAALAAARAALGAD